MSDGHEFDVLVVGGGPAGAATAYWLAESGHDVCVVEKKTYPREKTCGDGLTPRAVKQLTDMGLAPQLEQFHRYGGLRCMAHGKTLELAWPSHPDYPSHGFVVRRRDLDMMVSEHAQKSGATLWQGTEAVSPIVERGIARGAVVKRKEQGGKVEEIRAKYVVVADGSNSRFGRALGASRNREYPYGVAIRGYYESPKHDEPWIESSLEIRDKEGQVLPGYGWIFPVGDGTINVGVGLLSTFKNYKDVNTTKVLQSYVETAPEYWGISADTATCAPTGGKLPMGGSVGPKSGPGHLCVGDAAGTVNPFNGEGIDYAYETGRIAAGVLDEAITGRNPLALRRYEQELDDEYGRYFKVARLFAYVIGRPALMRELTRVGMHSRTLMEWVLRIMANLLRPDEIGPAEAAYKAAATLARAFPNR